MNSLKYIKYSLVLFLFFNGFLISAQEPINADNLKSTKPVKADGTYSNPIIHADFSDPDVILVNDTFYMVASSFNCIPGLPILASLDLIHWKLIGYAIHKLQPAEVYDKPQHGGGIWAPSIRYHNGIFYIYYGDPDFGIYVTTTKNPIGPWSEPVMVKEAKGWIDPCPFWDNDGKAYLVHAFAGSRAGIKSVLVINSMNDEGTKILDDGVLVFDGHENNQTVEGPKLYKRNGYYYIFAPAGGVKAGWQLALRSKNILGPYEGKKVLQQGKTEINGPHQGAWIETKTGESWFLHFQDKNAYGRVIHLQPMKWENDWPLVGCNINNDNIGEPVLRFKNPNVGKKYQPFLLQTTDEFDSDEMGLQWQWNANPQPGWFFLTRMGFIRLNAVILPDKASNLWEVPNLLLQKFPAKEFSATTKISFYAHNVGETVGLLIMGEDYSYIAVTLTNKGLKVFRFVCENASANIFETLVDSATIDTNTFYLKVSVNENAICNFAFGTNGKDFLELGKPFTAKPGKWIGAKVGLFCKRNTETNDCGYADIDWFRIEQK
jgi:beta-xylosidase